MFFHVLLPIYKNSLSIFKAWNIIYTCKMFIKQLKKHKNEL